MTVTNTVYISVYDLTTYLASGYNRIAVFTSTTSAGTFTEITGSGTRLVMVSGTEYYEYSHTGDSITDNLYRYKFAKSSGSGITGFITEEFYGNTSDLTETLRESIEDIEIGYYRYTIKELRRFIRNAIRKLQLTDYIRKFKVSNNGIISPRPTERDMGLIVQQAVLEISQSQLTRAADTNVSFSDGRGRYNVRTHEALIANIKVLKADIKDQIKVINSENINLYRIDVGINLATAYTDLSTTVIV